jgi:hypothetical protein
MSAYHKAAIRHVVQPAHDPGLSCGEVLRQLELLVMRAP